MYLNTRSIKDKLEEIQECIPDLDIFCASETWLNDNHESEDIVWHGMTLYRMDRPTRAGGVLIFVNNELANYAKINDECTFVNENIEIITVVIEKPNLKKK